MAELVGLLVMLMAVLFIALPILSFLRLGRISAELEALHERVRALEQAQTVEPARSPERAPEPEPIVSTEPRYTPQPASTSSEAPLVAVSGAEPPPIPRPAPVSEPLPPVVAEEPPADLEERIGGRGLLYVGVLGVLIGVSFFLKYAFDNEWINETGRVVLGAVAGLGLVAGGLRFAARGLDTFGHALTGAGFAILYLAIYAALNFYDLIGSGVAFALMVAVTLAAGSTAHRRRSQPLAFIAVAGGFLTPFLIGGNEDAQLMLFTYTAILIAATLVLSLRHAWVGLNAISYIFTYMTVLAWAGEYYEPDLWLRTLLFLTLFCVLFLIILRETRRSVRPLAKAVAGLLATGPVLYHIAAVLITAGHAPAIHLYLIAFTVVGLWLTAEPHRPWIRLAVLFGAFVPMLGTLTLPNGLSWVTANVVTITSIAALHFLALADRVGRQNEPLEKADLVSMHVAGLGLFSLIYSTLLPVYPEFRGALGAILSLAAIGFWQWLQPRDLVAALNAAALAFTLAALAIDVQFDGPAVVIGWAAEGAAAAWLGLRVRSIHFQAGGALLFALAVGRLLDGYFTTPSGFTPILNQRAFATLFILALGYTLAWLVTRYPFERSETTRIVINIGCSVLTMLWITAEIRSYWAVRYTTTQAYLYEQVMLSLAWAVYGAALIAIGMWRGYQPVRYIGIAIIGLTALKVFFYDLWELGGIYRVIGFIGFGALLVLVSYLYQKRRIVKTAAPDPPTPATFAPTDAPSPPDADRA